jgi:hypothetical protein
MNCQLSHKYGYVAATVLALILALAACAPFGKSPTQQAVPATPPPTETPLPAQPTFTPTPTATTVPAATPTAASAEEQPTLTPTSESATEVGGEEPAAATPVAYTYTRLPATGNVIENGSFEEGFQADGVGQGWTGFDNGGAVYAWLDETDIFHVSHGEHAQLMRTMGPAEPDRFVGIYQTVEVVAGETYTLTLHGLIHSSTATESKNPYGHRMQWAIDYQGSTDWQKINQEWEEWTDTGWNDVPLDARKPVMNAYVNQVTAKSDKLTLFIRGWTKWPIINSEAKFYVDGIFLEGPLPGGGKVVKVAVSKEGTSMPTTGGTPIWIPITGMVFVVGFAAWEVRKALAR